MSEARLLAATLDVCHKATPEEEMLSAEHLPIRDEPSLGKLLNQCVCVCVGVCVCVCVCMINVCPGQHINRHRMVSGVSSRSAQRMRDERNGTNEKRKEKKEGYLWFHVEWIQMNRQQHCPQGFSSNTF